ncbi:unnamed protein product [Moneuplotes crassus]|uniref:Uncharacterized protein n=1 Tax=Euplotes crassus TaxID=5936 RepID=A0AAD2DAQ8_EUPCR|nr:unnamed protein product [Moneuplotes crassus]
MNNSMMLPQVVKAPNFPKKIKRNNHVSANRSTSQTNRFNSHSERRIKLNTGSSLHRPAFNSNFSSRNSMAKLFKRKLFKTGAEVTKDFDPNTVYDGIEEIDLDLEEMEENMDNLDDTGLEETESDRLDEEIEILMEANKKLLQKVNICAGVVANGISKAATLKSMKPFEQEGVVDTDLRQKRRELKKIHSQIETEKRKVKTLENEFELICSSSLTDQNKMMELINQKKWLEKSVFELQQQADHLKNRLGEMKKFEKIVINKEKAEDIKHQMKVEIKNCKHSKLENSKQLHDLQVKNKSLGVEIVELQSVIRDLKQTKHQIHKDCDSKNKAAGEDESEEMKKIRKIKESMDSMAQRKDQLYEHAMKTKSARIQKLEGEISRANKVISSLNEANTKLSSETKALSQMSIGLQKKKETRNNSRPRDVINRSMVINTGVGPCL